jgi:tetratricopeptide (TPR) repeat protein
VLAADAFRECVRRDGGLSEAWANLGSVLGQLEQPREALVAMERAVELSRGSWRMWDNVATLAMRCERYSTACAALAQVVELRHSDPANPIADVEAYTALVHAACRGTRSSPALVGRVADLLAHATAACNKWQLWDLSAEVAAARGWTHDVPEHLRRALRAMDADLDGWQRGNSPLRAHPPMTADDAFRAVVRVLRALVDSLVRTDQPREAARVLQTYIDRIHASDALRTHPLLAELRQLADTL